MKRAYYSNSIIEFKKDLKDTILGKLTSNHTNNTLTDLQKNAWLDQIMILKKQLPNIPGKIYFEFSIPRMGKRVDNIVILRNVIFIVEFKVGSDNYSSAAIDQVIDYTVDLKNFHEGSHNAKLIPVLVATEAKQPINILEDVESYKTSLKVNKHNLYSEIDKVIKLSNSEIDIIAWEKSRYKPTPTIVEAAQALYKGHNVKEITRSDAGAKNLTITTSCINEIIENSKLNQMKSICFVTGVPGAGKTLAGLNIATQRMNIDKDEHAVFLSGNGPLVQVLREALTRDEVLASKQSSDPLNRREAAQKTTAFIQNVHHFRDEYLRDNSRPSEKVVVFDEAQRAWTMEQTSYFMKRKKGINNFDKSEPHFLIDVMNRHKDWCTIICLIGGGQEINTGEAGLEEWISSLKEKFSGWWVYFSNEIIKDKDYINSEDLREWLESKCENKEDLHLSTNVRSFRTEKVSDFVNSLLDLNIQKSKDLYREISLLYPIYLTRDLSKAKVWLRTIAKGNERIGLISSSGARRLRPTGVDVTNTIKPSNWFLNCKDDIRSSFFLEEIATEFDIQGLEIDYACLAWGGNFAIENNMWYYRSFKGTKWQNIKLEVAQNYLKNAYRVLLTRARQGLVIYIPFGDTNDKTRHPDFYDGTYSYLKGIGIKELL